MLTLPVKVFLFTVILQISLKSKLKLVFSQRFYQWTPKTLNIKVATLHRKTCTSKTEETMYQNKELEEWQFSRQPKTLSAGHCNATTIWIDKLTYFNLKKLLNRARLLSIKISLMTKSSFRTEVQIPSNQTSFTRYKLTIKWESKFVNLSWIFCKLTQFQGYKIRRVTLSQCNTSRWT